MIHVCLRALGHAVSITMIILALSGFAPLKACGLEAAINGGFTVSHPRSLEVSVAVARARREGLLPAATPTVPNEVMLRMMTADIIRLQRYFQQNNMSKNGLPESFSLVLVGPGLWSHFYPTKKSLLVRYHVGGPLKDSIVVLTHHVVLEALLNETLSAEDAVARGLILFSGENTDLVKNFFMSGFAQAANQSLPLQSVSIEQITKPLTSARLTHY